ncbi:MAG: helix-turn-helix domain-containing protein [Actinomycetota bacterium]|nr:helix-turn-helix domain-containing protein [Actinomycetota bacterium]
MTRELAQLTRAYRLSSTGEGRQIREESGISLRLLARTIGVNQGELSRWERGVARPRPGSAVRWLRAVDTIRTELDRVRGHSA